MALSKWLRSGIHPLATMSPNRNRLESSLSKWFHCPGAADQHPHLPPSLRSCNWKGSYLAWLSAVYLWTGVILLTEFRRSFMTLPWNLTSTALCSIQLSVLCKQLHVTKGQQRGLRDASFLGDFIAVAFISGYHRDTYCLIWSQDESQWENKCFYFLKFCFLALPDFIFH